MRAATPTFTFSMKRPDSGWGCIFNQFKRVYNKISKQVSAEAFAHDRARGKTETFKKRVNMYEKLSDRSDVWYYNEVNKRLAKHFGWDYPRSQHHKTKGWSKK